MALKQASPTLRLGPGVPCRARSGEPPPLCRAVSTVTASLLPWRPAPPTKMYPGTVAGSYGPAWSRGRGLTKRELPFKCTTARRPVLWYNTKFVQCS